MSKHIRCIILCTLLLAPLTGIEAQNKNTNSEPKNVVKVNQLDLIYQDENDAGYSDVNIESPATTSEDESYMYDYSPLTPPPPLEDDLADDEIDELPQVLQSHEDEGAESEDEILYASFDSQTIHYPKLDVNTITEPITLTLTHPDRDEGYSPPIAQTARVSSRFGPRRRRFHYGLDIAAPKGEPIKAMFDGQVRISVYNRSYGNLVVVRHNNGLETYYAHMSARHVESGDYVKAGDVLGLCGNTGRSFGSHLHLEIRYMGNAINPEMVINPNDRMLLSDQLTLTKESFRKPAKRGSSGGGSTYVKNGKHYYKVRSGDTLSKIARRNGTTVKRLCQLNGIKQESTLRIGQKIRVS